MSSSSHHSPGMTCPRSPRNPYSPLKPTWADKIIAPAARARHAEEKKRTITSFAGELQVGVTQPAAGRLHAISCLVVIERKKLPKPKKRRYRLALPKSPVVYSRKNLFYRRREARDGASAVWCAVSTHNCAFR